MMRKKLNSYSGNLTPSQVADGINAARRNASRLLTDAEILLNIGKYPSAAFLSILSIEESGKTHILRLLSVSKTDEDLLKAWKDYRSHVKKNVLWSFPQMIYKSAKKLDDFRSIFHQTSEHPYLLDQLKQSVFIQTA
jgi:AbiV family abortive infection protein